MKIWIVFFGLWVVSQGWADENTEDVFTLHRAVETALKRNPTLREAREKLVELSAQVGSARALLLPSVMTSGNWNHKKDALNLTPKFGGEAYNQYIFDVKANQSLFTFGSLAGLEIPKKNIELQEKTVETQSRDLSSSVIQSFYKLLLNERLLSILLEIETVEKDLLKTAQYRHHIGRAQLLDVLQVKTQLALLTPQIAESRTSIEISGAQLAALMGDLDRSTLRAKGTLVGIPYENLKASLRGIAPRFPERDKIDIAQVLLDDQRQTVMGKHYPQLSAVGDWNRSAFKQSDLVNSDSTAWSMGLQLSIPIFSGLSSVFDRKALASQEAQLAEERNSTETALAVNWITQQKNLDLASRNITSSVDAFELAEASLKEAKRSYHLATIDIEHFLTIQQAYLQALSSLNQAKYSYIVSLVNYFTAGGYPLEHLVKLLEEQSR